MKVAVNDTSKRVDGRGERTIHEMPQCPAMGDMIFKTDDSPGISVKMVLWCLYPDSDCDVEVRAW